MAGIGDLVVNLKADASQFNKQMASAKTSVKGFKGIAVPSFKSIASAAGSMITPITAAMTAITAASVGAGVAIYGLTGRMGEIAGMSDKAAQAGVSVKFLQQLGFAADQSGVSVETLNKSVGKLAIVTGQAASGNKAAQESFSRLGLNFADLQKLSPEQQFMEVAKAISALPTQADRAAASVAIFGKSGLEMTTLFSGGMSGIVDLMKEADRLGIGLNEEDVARVAAADDALQRMKASFGALVDQAIVGLAPAFEDIANTLTEWIAPLTKFLDGFNALEDKAKWMRDLLQAAMDVALQHIRVQWDKTMAYLAEKASELGKSFMKAMSTGDISGLQKIVGKALNNSLNQQFNRAQLGKAEARFRQVLRQPAEAAARQDQEDARKQQPQSVQPAQTDFRSMWNQALPWAQAALGVGKDLYGKATGGIMAKTPEAAKQIEYKSVQPAFATAANRGSSEAFKTILRSQRPEVKAMTTVAQQAPQQTAALRQIARNTTPQFAPEF